MIAVADSALLNTVPEKREEGTAKVGVARAPLARVLSSYENRTGIFSPEERKTVHIEQVSAKHYSCQSPTDHNGGKRVKKGAHTGKES